MSAGLGIFDSTKPQASHPSQATPTDAPSSQYDAPIPSRLPVSSNMQQLERIEQGGAMVELDATGSGIRQGQIFGEDCISPNGGSRLHRPNAQFLTVNPPQGGLNRHGTLLSVDDGGPSRRAATQLRTLLGNSHGKLKPGAILPPALDQPTYSGSTGTPYGTVTYEKARAGRARVEIDIELDGVVYVQGGDITGAIKLRVCKPQKSEWDVLISTGKIRVVGFETVRANDSRHIFFHCAKPLSSADARSLYKSDPDSDGFSYVRVGVHSIPFTLRVPVGNECKGVVGSLPAGIDIQYIIVASWQVKDEETGKRSIAHFYRHCEIWPRLNPSKALSRAIKPIVATKSQSLFMGGSGEVELKASLHRLIWVAGQQCFVEITVNNESKKSIKSVTLGLIRSTVAFVSQANNDPSDLEGCRSITTEKQVAEATLTASDRGTRGHASARGWWAGVMAGESRTFSFSLLLPLDALTASPGLLVEVNYSMKVSISPGALSSDVSVSLPLRIINFISLDPPSQTDVSPFKTATPSTTTREIPQSTLSSPKKRSVATALENASGAFTGQLQQELPSTNECRRETPTQIPPLQLSDFQIEDNEFVQFAIRQSEDQVPTSFSDLYYVSGPSTILQRDTELNVTQPETIYEDEEVQGADQTVEEEKHDDITTPKNKSHKFNTPLGPRPSGGFAQRVQEKMLLKQSNSTAQMEDVDQDEPQESHHTPSSLSDHPVDQLSQPSESSSDPHYSKYESDSSHPDTRPQAPSPIRAPEELQEVSRSSSGRRPLPIPPQIGRHAGQDCFSQMSKSYSNASSYGRAPTSSTLSYQGTVSPHDVSPPDLGLSSDSSRGVSASSQDTQVESGPEDSKNYDNASPEHSRESHSIVRTCTDGTSTSSGSMSAPSSPSSAQGNTEGSPRNETTDGAAMMPPLAKGEESTMVDSSSSSMEPDQHLADKEDVQKERPVSLSVKDKIRELEAKMRG